MFLNVSIFFLFTIDSIESENKQRLDITFALHLVHMFLKPILSCRFLLSHFYFFAGYLFTLVEETGLFVL